MTTEVIYQKARIYAVCGATFTTTKARDAHEDQCLLCETQLLREGSENG